MGGCVAPERAVTVAVFGTKSRRKRSRSDRGKQKAIFAFADTSDIADEAGPLRDCYHAWHWEWRCCCDETGMPQKVSKNVREGCRPRTHQDPEMEIEALSTENESLWAENEALKTQLEKLMDGSKGTAVRREKGVSEVENGFADSSEASKVASKKKSAADEPKAALGWYAKLKARNAMYEENQKYVVLGVVASSIENFMKEWVLLVLPKNRQKLYYYKEDGSRNDDAIEGMPYLDEVEANQEVRKHCVKAHFSSQESRYLEFKETMKVLKEVVERNDWGELLRHPEEDFTLAFLKPMIDGADLESIHKKRLKSYAAWIYPPSKMEPSKKQPSKKELSKESSEK